MSAHQSTQWFWSDWAGDQEVRRLTLAERGLWIDLLSLAAVGKPYGYVCDQRGNPISYEEIARFANATPTEVESLIANILEKGAASRDRTGRLFNRRMTRQAEKVAKKKVAGKLGAEQTKKVWSALKEQAFMSRQNSLPQQVPRQMPQHRETTPTNPINLNSSSEPVAAREKAATEGEVVVLPTRAKLPNEMTRQELDDFYAARREREKAKPRVEVNNS